MIRDCDALAVPPGASQVTWRATMDVLVPGARLGPYEVLAPLGAGGMGRVYRALDTRLHRTVAIKVLSPELSGDL